MVLKFVCCAVIEIIDFQSIKWLCKNLSIFSANRNTAGKALKSTGYMDTVLFLTIGKQDIYQLKSSVKSATVLYPDDQ